MLHVRMKWVDEVSVGISLCLLLLVLLISSMLNTLVPFLLKNDDKSASQNVVTMLNLVLPIKDELRAFSSFCIHCFVPMF